MTTSLSALVSHLVSQFPERTTAINALVTAVVAKEHAVVYGPPGTGKSLLARTIAASLGRSYFEYLMTRFTEPTEVMGAVDVAAFRNGQYIRNISGKMPTAEIVFLDEIFKANSAILNSLLTILNERTYDAGTGPCAVPLMSCIGASNELPEGPELEALYDRLLVRLDVGYIAEDDSFRSMLTSTGIAPFKGAIDIAAEQFAATQVKTTIETIDALIALRTACKKANIAVSDRRWRQCLNLVKAAAHVDGRIETCPEDLEILESVLWHKPSDKLETSKVVHSVISPAGGVATELLDNARDIMARVLNLATPTIEALSSACRDVQEVEASLSKLPTAKKVAAAKVEVAAIKRDIAQRTMRAAGVKL